jgi:hypothetical protein
MTDKELSKLHPVLLAPGVYVGCTTHIRDHEWACAHRVSHVVNAGIAALPRGRRVGRQFYDMPVDSSWVSSGKLLTADDLSIDSTSFVMTAAMVIEEARRGVRTVRGTGSEPGAVLFSCTTGLGAALLAVLGLGYLHLKQHKHTELGEHSTQVNDSADGSGDGGHEDTDLHEVVDLVNPCLQQFPWGRHITLTPSLTFRLHVRSPSE